MEFIRPQILVADDELLACMRDCLELQGLGGKPGQQKQ
jgi:hypothetical protein